MTMGHGGEQHLGYFENRAMSLERGGSKKQDNKKTTDSDRIETTHMTGEYDPLRKVRKNKPVT